jgi:signal transduction histidine kinase/CheY-like chemotaxis protein
VTEPAPLSSLAPEASADGLLQQWRERVLRAIIATSVVALIPPITIALWQATHGLQGAMSGALLAVGAAGSLACVGLAPVSFGVRARFVVAVGLAFTIAALFTEGLAPAQLVSMGLLTTVCVLLFSLRAAFLMLGACALATAVAAYGFTEGHLTPLSPSHLDSRNPLNWVRVSLYVMFPSATTAVATNYLLVKLRETLKARTGLVTQLSSEVQQKQAALAQLEHAQAQLLHAQKLEAIGQLAAGIAHDFNNTLSVISLEAEMLKRRGAAEPEIARGADAVLAASERGSQLTRQLLMFGRPGNSEHTVIDVAQAFSECVDALQRLLPSEIQFVVEKNVPAVAVRIGPSQLQQMVLNLGINARDAMPEGGQLRVTLSQVTLGASDEVGLPAGDYALLSCSDTGIGMNEATLARIFEPFFSTKKHGRGTGLGLTNVWNIVRMCGGAVRAQSALGHGTTFRVYLPVTTDPPSRISVGSGLTLGGHETVLVVEDDIRIRALLVTTLADAGYAVLDAPSADAAIALEREHVGKIDLLCTDVAMPGKPARELIAELRARRPETQVLVCSGYSEDERIARGVESGELKLLQKPFTRKALLASVRAALDDAQN